MVESLLFTREKELLDWAFRLGKLCHGNEVILLNGELGAGKTTFTRGFARGMGLKDLVSSPTFTYLNIYEKGPLRLFHYDLYRIHSPDDLEALGFFDYLGEAVICIEWAEKAMSILPEENLEIRFFFHDEGRKIEVKPASINNQDIIRFLENQKIEATGN